MEVLGFLAQESTIKDYLGQGSCACKNGKQAKHKLFPPPVDKETKTLLPSINFVMTSTSIMLYINH